MDRDLYIGQSNKSQKDKKAVLSVPKPFPGQTAVRRLKTDKFWNPEEELSAMISGDK